MQDGALCSLQNSLKGIDPRQEAQLSFSEEVIAPILVFAEVSNSAVSYVFAALLVAMLDFVQSCSFPIWEVTSFVS